MPWPSKQWVNCSCHKHIPNNRGNRTELLAECFPPLFQEHLYTLEASTVACIHLSRLEMYDYNNGRNTERTAPGNWIMNHWIEMQISIQPLVMRSPVSSSLIMSFKLLHDSNKWSQNKLQNSLQHEGQICTFRAIRRVTQWRLIAFQFSVISVQDTSVCSRVRMSTESGQISFLNSVQADTAVRKVFRGRRVKLTAYLHVLSRSKRYGALTPRHSTRYHKLYNSTLIQNFKILRPTSQATICNQLTSSLS